MPMYTWHDIHQQKWKWKLIHIQDLNQIDCSRTGGNSENVRPYQPTSKQPRHWHQTLHRLPLQGNFENRWIINMKEKKWFLHIPACIHRLSFQGEFVKYMKMTKQSEILKVIASEDWNGMREDFKMASDVITFRVDYAPRVSLLKYFFLFSYFLPLFMCSLCLLFFCGFVFVHMFSCGVLL